MYTVTKYPHGCFSWADCSATEFDATRTFYREVMGWEAVDLPMAEGAYTIFKLDGHDVVGLGLQQAGFPSAWNQYITVEDVDALMPRVTELGGTVIELPFEVGDNGRMALIQDPTGAMVCLWQPRAHIGSRIVNTKGAVGWNELHTTDMAAARDFYGGLLGWTFEEGEHTAQYQMFFLNGRVAGGMMPHENVSSDAASYWLLYFNVEDIHAVREKIRAHGGRILFETLDEVGPRITAADPSGAVAAYIQANRADEWVDPS
ncbi:MAG: VOC family protein [Anaerolineae bacterium]